MSVCSASRAPNEGYNRFSFAACLPTSFRAFSCVFRSHLDVHNIAGCRLAASMLLSGLVGGDACGQCEHLSRLEW